MSKNKSNQYSSWVFVSYLVFPLLILPNFVFANFAGYVQIPGIINLLDLLGTWLKAILPVLISLTIVWFVWNVFYYVIATNEDDKGNAKKDMVWGIVAIFVTVSIWGLVAILQNTFFKNGGTAGSPDIIQNIISPLEPPQ